MYFSPGEAMIDFKNKSLTAVRIFAILLLVYLIFMRDFAYAGAVRGMKICTEVVLPAVFPFSVAADLLVRCGLCSAVGGVTPKFLRKAFGFSPAGMGAYYVGILGGYPSGASAAGELYTSGQITKNEASRLNAVSNNPSFAYAFMLGKAVTGHDAGGVICWLSVILSSIIVSLLIRSDDHANANTARENSGTGILNGAIRHSAYSVLCIAGSVIFFSAVGEGALQLPISDLFSSFLLSLCEITSGLDRVILLDLPCGLLLSVTAFLLSLSGLCIFFQVSEISLSAGVDVKRYLFAKPLQAVISFLLAWAMFTVFLQ